MHTGHLNKRRKDSYWDECSSGYLGSVVFLLDVSLSTVIMVMLRPLKVFIYRMNLLFFVHRRRILSRPISVLAGSPAQTRLHVPG